MKCKQGLAAENPAALRHGIAALVESYFTAEDLEHLRQSHGFGGHEDGHDDGGH